MRLPDQAEQGLHDVPVPHSPSLHLRSRITALNSHGTAVQILAGGSGACVQWMTMPGTMCWCAYWKSVHWLLANSPPCTGKSPRKAPHGPLTELRSACAAIRNKICTAMEG